MPETIVAKELQLFSIFNDNYRFEILIISAHMLGQPSRR